MRRPNPGRVVWDGLLAGVGYRVESSTNLIAGDWSPMESFTATGAVHATVFTNSARTQESLRLSFE